MPSVTSSRTAGQNKSRAYDPAHFFAYPTVSRRRLLFFIRIYCDIASINHTNVIINVDVAKVLLIMQSTIVNATIINSIGGGNR